VGVLLDDAGFTSCGADTRELALLVAGEHITVGAGETTEELF
jgi:hypothetical protein